MGPPEVQALVEKIPRMYPDLRWGRALVKHLVSGSRFYFLRAAIWYEDALGTGVGTAGTLRSIYVNTPRLSVFSSSR